MFFASSAVLRQHGLMGMASMTVTDSEFADHKRLALHPKILAKTKELDDKVKNWKRLENMKAAALQEQQKKKERLQMKNEKI